MAARSSITPRRAQVPGGPIDAYMREVSRRPLLSPEQEHQAAIEIETLRLAFWRQILDYPPLVEAVTAVLRARLEPEPGTALDVALAEAEASVLACRFHDRLPERRRVAAATRALADLVVPHDPEIDLAGQIAADLSRLAAREPPLLLTAHPPRSTSSLWARHLEAVARSAADLRRAHGRFVEANLRLVVKAAGEFAHLATLADMIQEGNLGLMKAVWRFEPARGFRFSTYAIWWIRHTMRRAIVNRGRTVRIPQHLHTLAQKIARARRGLLVTMDREPTTAELAAAIEVDEQKVIRAMRGMVRPVSLEDAAIHRRYTIAETVPDDAPTADDLLDEIAEEARLALALGELDPRERDIVTRRFGFDGEKVPLAAIGEDYGLSRERIRQLQLEALARMRHTMEAP